MSQNEDNIRELNIEVEPAEAEIGEPVSSDDVTIWRYNGFEFSFDVGDADDAAHFEECMHRFADSEKAQPKDGTMAERIIAYDKMFRDMFDDVFGEGAGDDILGEKRSMRNCDSAYESFLSFIDGQNADFVRRRAALATRYSVPVNRAQRRAETRNASRRRTR